MDLHNKTWLIWQKYKNSATMPGDYFVNMFILKIGA